MRKEIFRMDRAEAIAMLRAAPHVHVATTDERGRPILRVLHGVVVGGSIAFHGAPAGEKIEAIGREAVISCEETVASIPSYFVDPERACPATTFYRSVQAHGRIDEVHDPERKAEVLAALMRRFQPEGGHVPIDARHPLYRKAIEGLLVFEVPLTYVDGKKKVGQNRRPEEIARICELLWRRGDPGDARAIELVLGANPSAPRPSFLEAPPGVSLTIAPSDDDALSAAALLRDQYWTRGLSAATLAAAHRASPAWVGARDASGDLVGTARAIGDGARLAMILDVCVAPALRGRGIGRALVRLLLDHPAVRHAARVQLRTRDARRLYEAFGFREGAGAAADSVAMTLDRPRPIGVASGATLGI